MISNTDFKALEYLYDIVDCDPDLADTKGPLRASWLCTADSNAFLHGKSDEPTQCCVVLASSRLDVNGAVRKRLGTRKASFASPEETIERSGGMMIGGVTPFGLPGDLPVWIDTLCGAWSARR